VQSEQNKGEKWRLT